MVASVFPLETNPLDTQRTPSRGAGRFFEALESRTLLSATLFVTGPATPVDATHFHTLQAALMVAATGDTIDLQAGFSPGTFVSTTLTQAAAAGAASLRTAASLDVGDVVTLGAGTAGDPRERVLVTGVTPTGSGDFQLTLATPLQFSHTSSAVDAGNGTLGPTIGLATGITLTADPGVSMPFNLEIWQTSASTQTTLTSLDLGSHTLMVDGNGSHITGSKLSTVTVQMSVHATTFSNDVFNMTSSNGLSLESADGTVMNGNTINVSAMSSFGVLVHNSANVLFTNNVVNTGSGATALYVSSDGMGVTSVDIRGNTFNTTDGFGLVLAKSDTTASLDARVQGNNFNNNAVGVYVVGDGDSAGNVDMGGGSSLFGTSTGGNVFTAFGASDAGHFAIGLFGTDDNYVLSANSNQWSVPAPTSVVADATHTVAANGSGIIVAAAVVQQETLAATAKSVSATETGLNAGIVVATFSSNLAHVAGDFGATIDWGDGISSAGTIVANADGTFSVLGTHTWDVAGSYQMTVTIASKGGASISASATATVAARTITLDGVDFTSDKNKAFSGVIAKFTDSLTGTAATSYVASIAWSDGMTTLGTITKNADGSFSISTARNFTKAGILVASVAVGTMDGSFSATANLTATITGSTDKTPHRCLHVCMRMIRHHCQSIRVPARVPHLNFAWHH